MYRICYTNKKIKAIYFYSANTTWVGKELIHRQEFIFYFKCMCLFMRLQYATRLKFRGYGESSDVVFDNL